MDGHTHVPEPTQSRRGAAAMLDHADPAFNFICHAIMELDSFGFDIDDPDIVQRAVERGRRYYEDMDKHLDRLDQAADRPSVPMDGEVVYYMRIGNRCKIGYSSTLATRLAAINPEELLATEPGTVKLERMRHREFSHLRTHGEWFRYECSLVEHVSRLQAAGGA